ncbi:MAG: S41 family peptidase [Planctomycetaceae bacterium]|nr:S41 family peptidase [Planctomycetaceae bacterium]
MFPLISRKFFTLFLLLAGIGFAVESYAAEGYASEKTFATPARPPKTTPKKITTPKPTLVKPGESRPVGSKAPAPIPDFSLFATSDADSDSVTAFDGSLTDSLDRLSNGSNGWDQKPLAPKNSLLPPLQSPLKARTPDQALVPKQRLEQILAEGARLEEKQLWSDAILVYEKGLKNFSTSPVLLKQYRLCRYQVELGRRYHDVTFEQLLRRTPLDEALKIYAEVFTQIHEKHIDSPDWKTLFEYGLDNLEIALGNQEFLQWNKIHASPEELESLCRKIRETAQPWSFRHIEDMKNGALNIADLVRNEIGLQYTVVLMEFVCGAACGLDPHTTFLTLRQLNDFFSTIEGSFVGIGIDIDTSDPKSDVLTIAKVHPNSPAMQAGLQDGDSIFAVNGTLTAGLGIDRAADLLQGEDGTAVVLQTKTSFGKHREIRIIRREIEIVSVEDVHLIDGKIGYIRINCFQASTTREMKNALETLRRQGMQSLILDLRGNPGGLLSVAVEVANLFLDRGIIVRTQDRSSQSETIRRAEVSGTNSVPLYVLIDEESASASELFAEAIQEHKRGVLIGTQSYGKGTVQILCRLPDNKVNTQVAGLKLTVERFYSPSGVSCCNVGVRPDIVIPSELEQTVVASKPDLTVGTIAEAAPKRKRITSSPDDPYVAKAMAISHSIP